MIIDGKKYYKTSEACKKAGISRPTLFRWLKKGIFQDVSLKDRRGWRLFTDEDVERLKKEANKVSIEPFQPRIKFNVDEEGGGQPRQTKKRHKPHGKEPT